VTGFGRILEDLNAAGVRYVLVGGIAVIRHGYIRATQDIDAVVAQDEENLRRIADLVERWDATRPDRTPLPTGAIAPDRTLHLQTPHGRLDLLTGAAEVVFDAMLARSDERRVEGVPARICSLADLVAMKRRAGRERDLLDLHELERIHGELPEPPDSP
jgi:predicted nucleotidyltransferase